MPTTSKDILVRNVMQGSTGLAEDVYINDFAFRFNGALNPTTADLTLLFAACSAFYRDLQSGGRASSEFISSAVSRAVTHEQQAVDISVGGSPIFTAPWLGPLAPITAFNNLPSEVAAVLSFHGELTGIVEEVGITRPRARRRGRIYFGPLIVEATTNSAANPLLEPSFTDTLREGATDMFDQAALAGFTWCVWSRMDNELYPVVGGWTDNAPDTQRRRGMTSTSRVTFTT